MEFSNKSPGDKRPQLHTRIDSEVVFEYNRTSSFVFDMHISSREGKGLEK
jgi:hypothetical protein